MSLFSWSISSLQNAGDLAFISSSSRCRTLSGCSFRFRAESRLILSSSIQSLIRLKRRERRMVDLQQCCNGYGEKPLATHVPDAPRATADCKKLNPGITVEH